MICLYNRKKPNQEELENEVESLRRKQEQSRRAARGDTGHANHTTSNTPNASTPPSRSGSPAKNASEKEKGKDNNGHHHHHGSREKIEYENGTNRGFMDSNFVRRARTGVDAAEDGRGKSRKHRSPRSRSRS